MRNLEFENQNDTIRYLNGTLARYKQEFVYVRIDRSCRGKHDIMVQPYGKPAVKIKCTDDDFSVHMPELGYVNSEEGAFYLKRRPQRVQRAGLAPDFVYYYGRSPDSGNMYLTQPEGYDMLMDIYPSFKECDTTVKWDGRRSMAFAKTLCISCPNRYSRVIEYRGEVVAVCDPRTSEWYIPEGRTDASFIAAILKRNGVNLNV